MKNLLIVLSDPSPGKEDEYNDWYSGPHLREVVATPGFVAAQRFRSVTTGEGGPPHSYLAIYEVEGDIEQAKASLAAGKPNRVPVPEAMAAARQSWWFTPVSDWVVASRGA
jgi:hypothetical protein